MSVANVSGPTGAGAPYFVAGSAIQPRENSRSLAPFGLLSEDQLERTISASRAGYARDRKVKEALAGLTIAGFVGGLVIVGDSARRWRKRTTAAPVAPADLTEPPRTIQGACPDGCSHGAGR